MAHSISRRHAFAGLGLGMASTIAIPRSLRAAVEPIESPAGDDRLVLHLEPQVKSEDALLEVFFLGRTGLETSYHFVGLLELSGRVKLSTTGVNIGSIPVMLTELWPAASYYRPIPLEIGTYFPEGEKFHYLRDSDFHLRSETMQGAAVARIADPWVVTHHEDVQARFDRVVSSFSGNLRKPICLIGSTLEYTDQMKSAAWTAQLCRKRTDILISVLPCFASATNKPSEPEDTQRFRHEAARLLHESADLNVQVQRSYFPTQHEEQFESCDRAIAEAIVFVSDLLSDSRTQARKQAFRALIGRARTAYWHQMFVSPSLSGRDALAAILEKIAHARKDREVVGTAFQVRYAPASREHEAVALAGELRSAFGQPSLLSGIQAISGREEKATVVQWLNLTNGKGAMIASG